MKPDEFLQKLSSIAPTIEKKAMYDSLEQAKIEVSKGIPPANRDITNIVKTSRDIQVGNPYEYFTELLKFKGNKIGIPYMKDPIKERLQGQSFTLTEKQRKMFASKGVFLRKNQSMRIPNRLPSYEQKLIDSVSQATTKIPEKIIKQIEKTFPDAEREV